MTVVIRPATGGVAMSDDAIARCDDPVALHAVLAGHWLPSLGRWLDDPEWPLRSDEGRAIALDYVHRIGLVLARLSELIESPPRDLILDARDRRALRLAEETLARYGGARLRAVT